MQNWDETLLSQYANSPTIVGLIEALNDAIDPTADLDALFSNLFNVSTAVGQGLNNWGQVVGVSRNLLIAATPTYLGFGEAHVAGDNLDAFGSGTFYPGQPATQTYTLADEAYRQLIMVKAAANICDLTAPTLNTLLNLALGLDKASGVAGDVLDAGVLGTFQLAQTPERAYVQDTGGMSQRYVLEFVPSAYQLAILLTSGVIPRSAGVSASVLVAPYGTFGFFEAGSPTTFADGTLMPNSGLQDAS